MERLPKPGIFRLPDIIKFGESETPNLKMNMDIHTETWNMLGLYSQSAEMRRELILSRLENKPDENH